MPFNLNQPVPLLFLGDGPDSPTGLGRIGHDLAWIASSMPTFKVGYLGRQAFGRARFPWTQYSFGVNEQWGEHRLEEAWEDLSQGQRGIIMTVWDASRLLWFADGRGTGLESFLNSGKFDRWGYVMADATGVDPSQLPAEQAHVLSKYQRVLMASRWAYGLAGGIAGPEMDWLPHPIDRSIFRPQDPLPIRSAWGLKPTDTLIGCVMTNQQRKLWPVVMEAVARMENVRLWMHADDLRRYWDLPALAIEYGIHNQIIFEGRPLSDRELAHRYAACNATVVMSGGEGFGYPVAESMSCGVPCVTGAYGAASELTPWLVPAALTAIETSHNVRRAAYNAIDVAGELMHVLAVKPKAEECQGYVEHLAMPLLSGLWKKWFKKGLQ